MIAATWSFKILPSVDTLFHVAVDVNRITKFKELLCQCVHAPCNARIYLLLLTEF